LSYVILGFEGPIVKKYLLAGIAAGAFCGAPAFAADMPLPAPAAPPPAVYSWTGFYVGGHIGGAWATDKVTVVDNNPLDTTHGFSQDPSGVFGGGQLGYNWQLVNVVFGVEADLGDMDLRSSVTRTNVVNGIPFQTTTEGGFYADVTGRLGYTAGPALFYAKGGYAFLEGGENVHAINPSFFIPETPARGFNGWTVGGGLEYALSPAWSMKLEYQHFDFGTISSVTKINGLCCSFSHDLTADALQVGVNWRFGGPGWGVAPVVVK
jgi:outer membrane immunogenic protein